MKGLAGLALSTGMLGCSQNTASSPQMSIPSTPGATSASQGSMGKLVAAYPSGVGQAAWSPDGTRIASVSKDSSIQIWEAHSGKTLVIYNGHQGGAGCLSWAPDGKRIVSGGGSDGNPKDAMIQIWNPETGILLRNYTHPDGIPGTTNAVSAVG